MTYEIVPATRAHVRAIVRTMRPEERAEVVAAGLEPRHAVHALHASSVASWCATVDGDVAAVWGVRGPLLAEIADVWIFTSPAIERIKFAFYREARARLPDLLRTRRVLWSSVAWGHEKSIRFWRMLGFRLGGPRPVGPNGEIFRDLILERREPEKPPFIICALPRSRTFWLSRFLSYGDYHCHHEQARHLRSLEDVRSWLSQDCTGTAETAAMPWWRLIGHYRPDARVLVVRRSVSAVVNSLLKLNMGFDRRSMAHEMNRLDRYLDRIEARVPGAMSVSFDELTQEVTCARIFEYCLPYNHDHDWWASMDGVNAQADMPDLMRYTSAHWAQMQKLASDCTQETRRIIMASHLGRRQFARDDITIQQDSLDTFWRDGQELFREHAHEVGPRAGIALDPNIELARLLEHKGAVQIMTARCNGRMFGYLATILSPSLEDKSAMIAEQNTFFVSKDFRGVGLRLQKASLAKLRERGVDEVIFRAGERGDGPRLGTLYERLGARPHGVLYSLMLRTA